MSSLFDDLSKEVSKSGVQKVVKSEANIFVRDIFRPDGTGKATKEETAASNVLQKIAGDLAGKYFPQKKADKVFAKLEKVAPFLTAKDLLSGDLGKIAESAINHWTGKDGKSKFKIDLAAMGFANDLFAGTQNKLTGGITPKEAMKILDTQAKNSYARKNLYFIEVSSVLQGASISETFNIYATDIEYSPVTITGEKNKIGGASADSVRSSDPVEMRITTLDDAAGTLRSWFDNQANATASANGTVSVPGKYAIKIKIWKARTSAGTAHIDEGIFRAANIDVSLSRREDALQELQMTFVQLDTFMPVSGKNNA